MTLYQQLTDQQKKELQSKLLDAISKADWAYVKAMDIIELAVITGLYDNVKYGVEIYNNENS